MALHVRRRIEVAAVAALQALANVAAANVHANRAAPVQAASAPYLLVYAREERAEPITMGRAERRLARTLILAIEPVTAEVTDSSALQNAIAFEVEAALSSDPTLGGTCRDLVYSGWNADVRAEGESAVGHARIEFLVTYQTTAGNPAVSI